MSFFPGEQQKATRHLVLMTNLGMKTICIFGIVSGLGGALIAGRRPLGEEKVTNVSARELVSVVFSRRLIVTNQKSIQESFLRLP